MLDQLAQRSGLKVTMGDQQGWVGDFIEAQAFAYLAVRSLDGRTLTFPGTTGVSRSLTGGRLVRPEETAAG